MQPYTKQKEYLSDRNQFVCFSAGNLCGKSLCISTEAFYHSTGKYPDWWEGIRFDRGINIALMGETAARIRDTIQCKLMNNFGKNDVDSIIKRMGVKDSISELLVKHKSGGRSRIIIFPYDCGPEKLQGYFPDVWLLDETPPQYVLEEVMVRSKKCGSYARVALTPICGNSDYIYNNNEFTKHKMTMFDACHLNGETIELLIGGLNREEMKKRVLGEM